MKIDNRLEVVTQSLRALAAASGPGSKLPSVRTLMEEFHVSPTTV
ncbi:MAG: GntR family transcriptional regulator [Rhizobiales bacterium]|nr:GntR family transcriptional regulator [Hyphomicrobiales bacterium]